jgi:hypothetical protein
MTSLGDDAQIRRVAEQIAEATLVRLADRVDEKLHLKEPAIHPLVKWLVGAIAGLGSAAIIGGGVWLVSSVSEMQKTLVRLDERMANGAVKDARFDALERRVIVLERYQQGDVK